MTGNSENQMTPPSLRNKNIASQGQGGWIGIDLGTSNCTAAVWDLSRSRCKVLRLGHANLARPPTGGGGKGGKIVPSAVLFCDESVIDADESEAKASQYCIPGLSSLVGNAAIQYFNKTTKNNGDGEKLEDNEQNHRYSGAMVTSFKRVVGKTSKQAKELQSSDPEFWNSLPFQSVIMDSDQDTVEDTKATKQQNQEHKERRDEFDEGYFDVLGDTINNPSLSQPQTQYDIKEGVKIRIQPLNCTQPTSNTSHKSSEHLITPLQATTLLLQSIRIAALEYLTNNNKSKIQAPGLIPPNGEASQRTMPNCIIGVPAHYSHAQRTAIQNAAKHAGFTGYVGVMTESTAAAMAYGLFVSPTISANTPITNNDDTSKSNIGRKNILVFDMGGGTTDVTIAAIDFEKVTDKVQFRVVATAGDQCLGGDNVDELLARHLWKQHAQQPQSNSPALEKEQEEEAREASEHQEFISLCRRAKEELCGNDEKGESNESDVAGMPETNVTLSGKEIRITRQEFDSAIQPLIDRAECVVDNALSALKESQQQDESLSGNVLIHEVVLVGGSTHIPTIRTMLRRKFPPPIHPELCTSISAETAVAQGLAIQAALVSGVVPLWELRNAMMLDVLPHSIGAWVSCAPTANGGNSGDDGVGNGAPFSKGDIMQPNNGGNKRDGGHFVPILHKDAPLPAMGSATFGLAAANQSGVTVIAAEHIGPGETYQCMGVFDFLLHRLNNEDGSHGQQRKVREIEIGMTLEISGKFIVSIFDKSDPEHREKRRRYLKEKAFRDGNKDENDVVLEEDEVLMEDYYREEEQRSASFSGTEIGLLLFCVILFALYVATRIAFSNVELGYDENDEL